ncbi:UNKNOWN [Stylonychia lemnae]|uniref:Uncharacterized protein n=1 Tax=Stylonychia lemnae TaxID=5949 RepID=A0A078A201_STYLE|nr:UNKNOWN [Stylonychia lemnae]|eukprot:CDW76165.1 UNKNOWN [Stylonychia lemnae]
MQNSSNTQILQFNKAQKNQSSDSSILQDDDTSLQSLPLITAQFPILELMPALQKGNLFEGQNEISHDFIKISQEISPDKRYRNKNISVRSSPAKLNKNQSINGSPSINSINDLSPKKISPWIEIRLRKGHRDGNVTYYRKKTCENNVIRFNGQTDKTLIKLKPTQFKNNENIDQNKIGSDNNVPKINNTDDQNQTILEQQNYSCMLRAMKAQLLKEYRNRKALHSHQVQVQKSTNQTSTATPSSVNPFFNMIRSNRKQSADKNTIDVFKSKESGKIINLKPSALEVQSNSTTTNHKRCNAVNTQKAALQIKNMQFSNIFHKRAKDSQLFNDQGHNPYPHPKSQNSNRQQMSTILTTQPQITSRPITACGDLKKEKERCFRKDQQKESSKINKSFDNSRRNVQVSYSIVNFGECINTSQSTTSSSLFLMKRMLGNKRLLSNDLLSSLGDSQKQFAQQNLQMKIRQNNLNSSVVINTDDNQIQDITPKNLIEFQIPRPNILEKKPFEEQSIYQNRLAAQNQIPYLNLNANHIQTQSRVIKSKSKKSSRYMRAASGQVENSDYINNQENYQKYIFSQQIQHKKGGEHRHLDQQRKIKSTMNKIGDIFSEISLKKNIDNENNICAMVRNIPTTANACI